MKHFRLSRLEVFRAVYAAVTRRARHAACGAAALAAAMLSAATTASAEPAAPALGVNGAETEAETAHAFTLPGIDGAPLTLAQFAGQPMLVVNTASQCGFTGQYEGLQALWTEHRAAGLVVIGAPSDDFNQELGSAEKVKAFCEGVFSVTFPLTDILHVKGADAHPFFAWAAARSRAPNWNFNKYLIDAEGALVRHYRSSVTPAQISSDIKALLGGA